MRGAAMFTVWETTRAARLTPGRPRARSTPTCVPLVYGSPYASGGAVRCSRRPQYWL